MVNVLDLNFLGYEHAIASFMLESEDGLVLIESGPYSTFENLQSQIEKQGHNIEEVKHVLLTHIHFDHAGAAWALAEKGAKIYVHPFGSKHLQDPTILYNSAKKIYGDQMETLWGQMKSIDSKQIYIPDDNETIKIGEKEFTALYTPGHAKHHIVWKYGETIFTGDVAGVKIENGPVVPPCPPPDINLEDWNQSIDKILDQDAKRLYLTHYDAITDIESHMSDLKIMLNDWAFWIKTEMDKGRTAEQMTPDFMEYTAHQLSERGVNEIGLKQYEAANPSWMSVAGLIRYWKKKEESH